MGPTSSAPVAIFVPEQSAIQNSHGCAAANFLRKTLEVTVFPNEASGQSGLMLRCAIFLRVPCVSVSSVDRGNQSRTEIRVVRFVCCGDSTWEDCVRVSPWLCGDWLTWPLHGPAKLIASLTATSAEHRDATEQQSGVDVRGWEGQLRGLRGSHRRCCGRAFRRYAT